MIKSKSIEVADTNGSLKEAAFKSVSELPAVVASFEDNNYGRVLKVSAANVALELTTEVANKFTYRQVLQYNGTLGSSTRTFQQRLVDETFKQDSLSAPELRYAPNEVVRIIGEDLDELVIDLSMCQDLQDALSIREEDLTRSGKVYKSVPRSIYPTIIKRLPNTEADTVYLDGWYTYTFMRFIDVKSGDSIADGTFFSYEGAIYQATLKTPTGVGIVVILQDVVAVVDKDTYQGYQESLGLGNQPDPEDYGYSEDLSNPDYMPTDPDYVPIDPEPVVECVPLLSDKILEEEALKLSLLDEILLNYGLSPLSGDTNTEWEELRAQIKVYDGVGDNYMVSFVDSQLLITDDLRDAIIAETICAAEKGVENPCDIADWQTLSLKRKGALIMFENGLYRNAQKIMESVRKLCKAKIEHGC